MTRSTEEPNVGGCQIICSGGSGNGNVGSGSLLVTSRRPPSSEVKSTEHVIGKLKEDFVFVAGEQATSIPARAKIVKAVA